MRLELHGGQGGGHLPVPGGLPSTSLCRSIRKGEMTWQQLATKSEEQGCFLEFAHGVHGALGLARFQPWMARIYEIINPSCTASR